MVASSQPEGCRRLRHEASQGRAEAREVAAGRRGDVVLVSVLADTRSEFDVRFSKCAAFIVAPMALIFLLYFFSANTFLSSNDLVHHLVLVDEIARYHTVLASDAGHLGYMAYYPPASHWIAALLSTLAGSGLEAITLVSAASIFACYLMLFWLAQYGFSIAASAILTLVVIFSGPLHSLIGWEVVVNFFYPQLVAEVFAIAFLCSMVRSQTFRRLLPILTPISCAVLMEFQPLVAIQVVGFGLSFMTIEIARNLFEAKRVSPAQPVVLILAVAACVVAIITNQRFWFMRNASNLNGYLEFGFSHITFAIVPVLGVAAALLCPYVLRRGSRADAILGGAIASSTLLMIAQEIAFLALNAGSPYAVKKHFFMVTTLSCVGLARLGGAFFKRHRASSTALVGVLASTAITLWIVTPQLVPAQIVLSPLHYAEQARARLNAAPATIASGDTTLVPIANIIVSVVGFGHSDRGSYRPYFNGNGGRDLSSLVMVRRSPSIDRNCPDQAMPSREFAIVKSECLARYTFGETISFGIKGNDINYIKAAEWNGPENWGRWSTGKGGSSIIFNAESGHAGLVMSVRAIGRQPNGPRFVHVNCNGIDVGTWRLKDSEETYTTDIPPDVSSGGMTTISFVPDWLGENSVSQELGIGVKSIVLTEVAPRL